MLSAPYHPYNGALFMIEVQKEKNTVQDVEAFVKNDPYFKGGLLESYSVDPVQITHTDQEFERTTQKYFARS